MRISVFAWDANPNVDRRLYPISKNQALQMVAENNARLITLPDGRRAVQKFPPQEILLKKSARNCLTSIGRILNRLQDPPSLNYPVPAVGDHRLKWHNRFMTYSKKESQPLYA